MPRMRYCTAVRRMGDTFSSRPNIRLPASGSMSQIVNVHDWDGFPMPPQSFREVNSIVIRQAAEESACLGTKVMSARSADCDSLQPQAADDLLHVDAVAAVHPGGDEVLSGPGVSGVVAHPVVLGSVV